MTGTTPVTETYTALERGVVDGMVVMNKSKWESLPADVQKVIDENSGLAMSLWCGKVYDETDEPFKQQALKKGIQVIEFAPADMKKLEDLTLPLRDQWIKNMASKGLPDKAVLDSALQFLQEN